MLLILMLACAGTKTAEDLHASGATDSGTDGATTGGGATDGGTTDYSGMSYSEVCQHDLPSDIADAAGAFEITGVEGAPGPLPAGAALDGTGGLEIVACVPDLESPSPILDELVVSVRLSLFDHDDALLDLGVGDDATGVQAATGDITDWGDVVTWDEGGTFLYFTGGQASFSEIDKDGGRLAGAVQVTETDPPGYGMDIEIDLTW